MLAADAKFLASKPWDALSMEDIAAHNVTISNAIRSAMNRVPWGPGSASSSAGQALTGGLDDATVRRLEAQETRVNLFKDEVDVL
eukprot:13119960-Heterocapsa_arctica.AAC.1